MSEQLSRLGSYTIQREVGRGGMGVVYLARDSRLDRDVAIKVLPPELAQDPERLARFEREARLLASLNHPNIAAIYGLEQDGSTRFLVLEYIEGLTLAERLQAGPMPVEEVMNVCRQIAAAVEAAHDSGVIHRDLKPANVKITPNGEVKVLDFGLAKGDSGSAESSMDISQSPTISAHFTVAGAIMGTAAYMSPEQARGKPLDRRTDIFSFGCVLYECLTGRKLFAGETVSDTIAKILEREPDFSVLPEATPRRVRDLLRRCLEKDAKKRQRDIGDARLAFEEVEEARASSIRAAREGKTSAGGSAAGSRRSLLLAWGVAAAAIIAAVVGFTSSGLFQKRAPAPTVRFEATAPPGVRMSQGAAGVVMSPTGNHLVWHGTDPINGRQLFIRELNTLESRPLPRTQNPAGIFWSPDGTSLGFIDGAKLRTISIDGGDPHAVCDATSSRGGSWGKEYIAFALEQGPIQKVPFSGGDPEAATTLGAGESAHRFPHFLPDGETFLYVVLPGKAGRFRIMAASVHGGEPVEVMTAASSPVYAAPGYLIYQRGERLVAHAFSAKNLAISGEPVVIGTAPPRPPAQGAPAASASQNGHLVSVSAQDLNTKLSWLDEAGREIESLALDPGRYLEPAVSPDGRFVALVKELSPEESDIWVLELERMVMTRLTNGPGKHDLPTWSPDGKHIAYTTDAEGPWNIFRKPFPGGGEPEPVAVNDALFKNPMDWSPDGKFLLYEQIGAGTNMDLWIAPMDGSGEPRPYLVNTHQEEAGKFSPDGKWVAFGSMETGEMSVYVESFPNPGRKHRVSVGRGGSPMWAADGKSIVYGGVGGAVYRVPVTIEPGFRAGVPKPLFATGDGFVDGFWDPLRARFITAKTASEAAPTAATVVLNWANELDAN